MQSDFFSLIEEKYLQWCEQFHQPFTTHVASIPYLNGSQTLWCGIVEFLTIKEIYNKKNMGIHIIVN